MAKTQSRPARLSKTPETGYPDDVALRLINDYIFKYVFGREESKDVLLDLVNAIMEDAGRSRIRNLTLGNPIQGRRSKFLKETVLDIRAEDEHDRQFDIEIQVNSNPYFVNRSLFYWAQLYSSQLDRGFTYGRLRPVICINILAFTLLRICRAVTTGS
ncbi:MAG: Rpn family recombination-promoting nuclease/putative transposase [Clostridia bacterium]|jgi:predicted transposase/invertase (TIGR01784 family)